MTPPLKSFVLVMLWASIASGILYFTIFAPSQLLFTSPLTSIGIGLIGLGMCIDTRRKLVLAKAQNNPAQSHR